MVRQKPRCNADSNLIYNTCYSYEHYPPPISIARANAYGSNTVEALTTVNAAPVAPAIFVANGGGYEGVETRKTITPTGFTNPAYTVTLSDDTAAPAWVTVVGSEVVLNPPFGTVPAGAPFQPFTFKITATEGSTTASGTFIFTLLPSSGPPAVLPGDTYFDTRHDVTAGKSTELDVISHVTSEPAISFSQLVGNGNPTWVGINNPDPGLFTVNPPDTALGNQDISFRFCNDNNQESCTEFTLQLRVVAPAIFVATGGGSEGVEYRRTITTTGFTNPIYTVTLSDDTAAPNWVTVVGSEVVLNPPFGTVEPAGATHQAFTFKVTATEGSTTASGTFIFTLLPSSGPPAVISGDPYFDTRHDVIAGESTTLDVVSHVTQVPAISFTQLVGDDNPTWVTINAPNPGEFTVTPPATALGNQDISFKLCNNGVESCTNFTLRLRVVAPPDTTAPSFGTTVTVPNQIYIVGTAITALTLPEATGGDGDLTYSLTDLPAGLTFDAATRIISGTPTDPATVATYTLTAIDADTNTAASDAATLTFKVIVFKETSAMTVTETVDVGDDSVTATLTRGPNTLSFTGYLITAFRNSGDVAFTSSNASLTNRQVINSVKVFTLLENKVVDIDIFNEGACTEVARCGITLSYTQADLDALKVKDPSKDLLVLHYTGGVDGKWEALPSEVDVGSRTVTGLAFKFSLFVLGTKSSFTEEVVAQLNKAIMTRFTQVLVASTVASVEKRVGANFSGKPLTASYQFDGHTVQIDDQVTLSNSFQDTLEGKLPGYIKSLKDDTMDWKQVLSNSSFILPLSVDDNDSGDAGLTVWGGVDYLNMSGDSEENGAKLDWSGSMSGLQLGVDGRVRDDLLVGGLLSLSKGDAEYTLNEVEGTYKHKMTSVHPYVARSSGDTNMWGGAGYGKGKLAIKHDDTVGNADTSMFSLSAGIKEKLSRGSGLSIKGDVSLASTTIGDIDGNAIISGVKSVKSQRLRLVLESAQERTLSSGGKFTPVMEVGVRYDGGDGETGIGVVLGAGVRYVNAKGLTAEGKIHTLVGQKNYKEWGIQGVIRQVAGTNGKGLSFSLSPSYGHTDDNANQVWNQNLPVGDGNQTDDYNMQVKARLGYGMFASGGRGLLTPYSEITLGDNSRNYGLGITWKRDSLFDMKLSGERKESSGGIDTHHVLLESIIRF